mgnify:CR=1 FL=1|jgi:acid phosphatase type 7
MQARVLAYFLTFSLILVSISSPVSGEVESDGPEQIHLALSELSSEMIVTWVTSSHTDGGVEWGLSASSLNNSASGTNHTYTADDWEGVIHDAVMGTLLPGTVYFYRVGNDADGWSAVYSFSTAPADDSRVRIGLIGDMDETNGARNVVSEMANQNLGLVLFAGDLSYAYDSARFWDKVDGDEWDDWGRLYQPVSANTPTMFAVGNHENEEQDGCEGCGFQAYLNRVNMPYAASGSNSEFWYSFNYSLFHIISISTEHDFDNGSEQVEWLTNDLQLANLDRESHPWVLVMFHRPMYSSTTGGHGSDLEIRSALEPLFVQHSVNIVVTGHDHNYERTFPVNSSHASQTNTSQFVSPDAPIHLVVGTGGRLLYRYDSSEPTWSAAYDSTTHGYGVLELLNEEALQFTFYDDEHGDVVDTFTISRGEPVIPEHTPNYQPETQIMLKIAGIVLVGFVAFIAGWLYRMFRFNYLNR